MTHFIAPQFDNMPRELRLLPKWVTWSAEGAPGEKPRKVPYAPDRPNTRASSTDYTTWGTFTQAEASYLEGDRTGVGIVLDGDSLVGVDIDHCVLDGTPDPAAIALLEKLGAGYIELSPSGTGLRAFGYADGLATGCKGKLNGLDVELYSTGRYLTLTGQTIKAGPIAPLGGFGELAEAIRADRKVNPATGKMEQTAPDEHHAELVRRVLSGDVFHDSLRDLAASLVSTGMHAGAVVNHLRGLMDASDAPRDDRWAARRGQIPALVDSAAVKFAPVHMDFTGMVESAKAANEQRYKLLNGSDLAALPDLQWRVRGVLPTLGLAAIYGPSGSGKSFLAFDLACAIAEGARWFGCRTEAAPVVYACLEGEAGLKLRAKAWETQYGRPLPDNMRLMVQGFKLTTPQDVADLAAVVPPGAVLFLDTLNRATPTSDENSSKDMGEILEASKLLQGHTQGLVVPVHHTGKDTTRGLRGHSSLFAAMDAAVEVSRAEGSERRGWKVAKSKDGADGIEHQFSLAVVPMGEDEHGDPIDSCVVQRESSASKQPKALSKSQAAAMTSYNDAAKLYGLLDGEGKYAGLHVDAWRPEFYRTHTADTAEAKQKAFQRVRRELVDLGQLKVSEDVYRACGLVAPLMETVISEALTAAKVAMEGAETQADIPDTSGHCPDLSAAKTHKQADGQDNTL